MTARIHILLVDNYDSFTYNLQHLIATNADTDLTVRRNDENFIDDIERGMYAGVVIGPGPGSPQDKNYFGFNSTVILEYGTRGLPILGVCLGFQGIYHCFGGTLQIAQLPMHGRVSELQIVNNGQMLRDVPNRARIMRYHSILADLDSSIPDCFNLNAYTHPDASETINGKELMAIEHKEHPIYGLQFHPESFATEYGNLILANFIEKCRAVKAG